MENITGDFNQGVNELYAGNTPMPAVTDLGLTDPSPDPMQVKQRVSGAAPNPLPSQIPPGTKKTFDPRAEMTAMRNYLDAEVYSAEDKNDWAKAYAYNPGPNGGAFYEKYAPLQEHGKLEFHPLYNNAELFDKNTNFLGDMKRTLTQSFVPLIWNGVKGTFSSTARMFSQGDFLGEDPKLARDYAYYTAKSYSTKNNFGSFVNNLTMNFGYTVGIMGTAMFENWAGGLINGFSGVKTATQASARLAFKEFQAGKSFDGLKSYSNMLEDMKDIGKVRKAFDEANGISRFERGITSPVGQVLNPFSNLTDNYYSILKDPTEFTGYMQSSRNLMNTAGAAYRDFRNINLAISEARLEAGMVYNNMTNDLYNEFYSRNGRVPNDEEMKDIIAQAKQAGYETSFMNAGLIYLTNKISFDNILNPRVGSQGFLKQRIQDWKTIGGGRFGALGNVGLDAANNQWKFYEKGFKNWWKGWKTDPFSKSFLNTVGYFKRNLTEGIQESLQETISAANEKYYKDSFYTAPVRKNLVSKAAFGKGTTPLSYYGEGLQEQFSQEGFATFASGFAMGSLAGGLNKSMTFLYEKGNQIFDPKGYEEYKSEKSKIVTGLVDRMNAMGVEDFLSSKLLSSGTQDILARVQTTGNKKEVMDAESEALVDHISTLLDYGVFDMYMESFESYKQMTDAEFEEAFPKVPKGEASKYKGRIDEVIDKAHKIKDRYEYYTKAFPNPIDLEKYSKDDYDYEDAYLMKYMWDWGVKSAVFYNETFDNTRERMAKIMDQHYTERPLQSMTKRQSDIILRPEEMKNEIGLLSNEIQNLIAVGDPTSKEAAKTKKRELDSLQQYYDAYQEFSIYYHRDRYYNRAKAILQDKKAEGEVVTDEEVEDFLDDQFGPKTKETEQDLLLGLEEAYNKLLRSISGKQDDYLFTDNIDEAFEMVLDFYKLNDESREMVDYINLLHDPNGFMDVYKRNLDWMNDLWLKRGDYYRDIVTQELSDIEDNGLLNYLAKMGIFMESNDFILYRDQGLPPKEFYDEKKQLVIPEGSLAYDRYMEILKRYEGVKAIEEFAKEQAKNSELEVRIAELQERKQAQLEKAEQVFEENLLATTGESREDWEQKETPETTGRTKEEIRAEIDGLRANIKLIDDTTDVAELLNLYEAYAEQGLIPENYTEIVDSEFETNNEAVTKFFKSTKKQDAPIEARQQATGIKFALPRILKDKIAELESEEPKQEGTSVPPIQTTAAYIDYQKAVKKINERYKEFVEKLKAQISKTTAEEPVKAKPATTTKERKIEVSTTTKWDDLPDDFKTELQQIFDEYLVKPSPEGLGQPADLRRINPSKFELLRNNWFEQQSDLVDEYNNREVVKKAAVIKYLDLKKPLEEYGLTQLRAMRDQLQVIMDRNSVDNRPLNNNEKAAIKNDLAEIQRVLTDLRNNYVPKDNSERVFRIFEEMVINKQNGVSRILDAEGNTTGYEFPDAEGRPMRVTKLTEEIENKMESKDPFVYDAVQESYVDEKGNKRGGQLLNLFRELKNDTDIKSDEERLKLFMAGLETTVKDGKLGQLNSQRKLDAIRKGLTNNFTEEALIAVVKGVAYDESTIAGNTIDRMAREAFTINPEGGFVKPEKPAKMSQQAYDNLFGDFGVITELQDSVIDGKFKILSDDVIIYDQTLLDSGLVGAMDLVAFDTETGELMIIDIKTGKPENWDNFNKEDKYSKKLAYRLQQSIYRALVFNMTGELASKIAILPISIITDKDGNIQSAESAAAKVNSPQIRELENKVLALNESSKPDTAKIKQLEKQIKDLKKANTVALEPVKEIEDYGVVMKQPELPENLRVNAPAKEQPGEKELTPEQKVAEIKKLKKRLNDINKKLAGLKDGGVIILGDVVTMSPEYDKLMKNKTVTEAALEKLEGKAPEEPVKETNDVDEELDALKKGMREVFPQPTTVTSEEFKKYLESVRNAKTLEQLQEAYDDAVFMIIAEPEVVFGDMLRNAYELKLLALQVDVSEQNLVKGDYLISEKPIFTENGNEIVVVKKVGDGKVVVRELGVKSPRQKTFTEAQIKASFTKTTEQALKQDEEDMTITPEEKQNAAISKSSIEAFSKNPDLINEANKNAEKSKSDRLSALKDASKNNNINNCNE